MEREHKVNGNKFEIQTQNILVFFIAWKQKICKKNILLLFYLIYKISRQISIFSFKSTWSEYASVQKE